MSSAAHISEAQLKANRENATRSTGPRTEAGKNRARLNGLRHGLSGHTVVMPLRRPRSIRSLRRSDRRKPAA
jgi:hypothetical protein